jgi:hypothetical protein
MVTLLKSGMIGLNSAVTRNIVGENKYAHLFFDKEKRLIGFRFQKNNDQDAYPIKCTKSMSHGTIAGVSFLKTFGAFPDETIAYPANFDETNKILVVDISGAESAKGGTRKRARA